MENSQEKESAFSKVSYLMLDYRRKLSVIEIFIVFLIFLAQLMSYLEYQERAGNQVEIAKIVIWAFSPNNGLAIFAVLIGEILCFILFERTVFVLYISSASSIFLKRSNYPKSLEHDLHLGTSEKEGETPKLEIIEESKTYQENPSSYIISLVKRAETTARAAQRRAVALIFVGTLVAGSGLVFFVATLPIDYNGEINQRLLYIVPRILMLLFIQVLAGFFLRQYRNSMEEYRFYERLLRRREDQMLTYLIYEKNSSEKLRTYFLDSLRSEKDLEKLTKDETTISLETQKISSNEFSTLIDKVVEIVKQRTSSTQDEKNKAE